MTEPKTPQGDALNALRWPLRLTRAGMVAERLTRAFWPLASLLLALAAVLSFGLHDMVSRGWALVVLALAAVAMVVAFGLGVRSFRWPSRAEALDRLDRTLPGRPITALRDHQAVGAGDAASEAVWRAHVARMADRARAARAVSPDLRVASRDPYALRYVALTAFVVALAFGSLWRVASVGDLASDGGAALAAGPTWEGWIEPPAHTAKPSLYLNEIRAETLSVPHGSRVMLRLYGEVGALTLRETVSARPVEGSAPQGADAMAQSFEMVRPGEVAIEGPGGRSWQIVLTPDTPPAIEADGPPEVQANGQMAQGFTARDDYGVVAGRAVVRLDAGAVDRRYGLLPEPDPREPLVLDLPMTITGDRRDFSETLIENLSQHPWAGLPVQMVLIAQDALGQEGTSPPVAMMLPGRRFFDPLARAVVEQRRDLLWTRTNGAQVARMLRAVSHEPDGLFRTERAYLMLRVAIRRLEAGVAAGLSAEIQDEIAAALWDIAVLIEEGDLSDAAERLRRAQERLSEAMREGASNEEIAELMRELREAMQDYMRQLAQQQSQDGQQQAQNQQDMQEITGDQLEQMLERLQQLMEEGRMDEAQQLLEMLRQMMENMQITQGQGGQQSPGQQAMEGLAETLRQQQGLSDESFRGLQDQFNPGQQGQQGDGQQGQGQDGQGQQFGEGQGQGQGQGQQPGAGGDGGDLGQQLADRQRALQRELDRQREGLPGLGGSPEGEAAREALDRAGRAMGEAEDALRGDDLAGALDSQAEAMEALREGMRNLGEALAQNQQPGQQGEGMGQAQAGGDRRDPLGRDQSTMGRVGTEQEMLRGEDVQGRARELLDEIRRRSGEQERPEIELDYLRRLLDRF
ncbi:TIGR02302 family protein [Rhodovulum tesquicola]|uniref:TIGR02302 family protein n=1 Tax=Rhodovulum tesquicola TaxID=540254 RepID=UPI0020976326|nr:TIGR02302 family protein [Rhodovulum tesquicola]MCO8145516.1 TIGR02302 family protein [Rhodovulum tesquicola]